MGLAALLTPSRRRGVEILDDPDCDAPLRERSLSDVTRANRWFGGTRAAVRALEELLPDLRRLGRPVTLLDVGAGLCDVTRRVTEVAGERGVTVRAVGCDFAESLLRSPRCGGLQRLVADARRLPVRDRSVDLVLCSQLLHHFSGSEATAVLAELNRVAAVGVIVSDLRRSWLAAGGLWAVSYPMRFHPVSRHDGVTSVLRGFVVNELAEMIRSATGREAVVRRHLGWRLTATWRPAP
jgi:hypothetical protein